jgi:hypothetical protein
MKFLRYLFLLPALLIFSCSDDDHVDPNLVDLTFNFTHLVDDVPVQLDQLIYKNTLNQEFSIKTVKYFISGIKLYKDDNCVIEAPDIHYVDIRTPETLTYLLSKKISIGDYTGISFVYGLTPEENISGSLGLELDQLMEWPIHMGGGYHYMKLEGEYKTTAEESLFNFHSGMLKGTPYEIHVDFKNQPFTISNGKMVINVVMEIQNWFTNPTDWDFVSFGPAIMGNATAQKAVHDNGVDVFNFEVLENLE